jgi:transcriptional regulator with XRE-family HTH domain
MKLRLRELREGRGLTLEKVALALGVANSTIGRWEKGERNPGTNDLNALAMFYNVDITDLFHKPEDAAPHKSIMEIVHIAEKMPPEDIDMLLSVARRMRAA